VAVPLTDRFANTQRDNPPARGQAFFWDTDTKGFGLRTTERGVQAWVLQYRRHGRTVRLSIGNRPEWSARQARTRAQELKRINDVGEDPAGVRPHAKGTRRVSDLIDAYLAATLHLRRAGTQAGIVRRFRTWVLPELGKLGLAELDVKKAQALHRKVAEKNGGGMAGANHTIKSLSAMCNWGLK